MIRIPTHRPPTHPGEMLYEEFMKPLGLSRRELARRIGVPPRRIALLVRHERAMTPDLSLRLARLFGTSWEFWINGQLEWDLYHAMHSPSARTIDVIEPIATA